MRELLRSMARFSMQNRGVTRINRPHGKDDQSYFSRNWRKEIGLTMKGERYAKVK